MTTSSSKGRNGAHWSAFLAATIVFGVAFAAFLGIQPLSDLNAHIDYAERIRSPSDITMPHLLFHLLVKLVAAIARDYQAAAVIVLAMCYGGIAFLLSREMERRGSSLGRTGTMVVVISTLLACHIFLFTLDRPNLYYGYFVPIAYHSPTQQLGKFFALWTLFVYCRHFLDGRAPSASAVALIAALCILSALAKPSFLIAFLPSAACVAAMDMAHGRWRRAWLAAAFALPVSAVLLWQRQLWYGGGNSPRIMFAPFAVFDARETMYKLPLSLAFPLFVWGIAAWRRTSDARLWFTALLTAVGLSITLLLAEDGWLREGNFAWTGQTAVFLAYVESMLFVTARRDFPVLRRVAWAVFGVHVICGIIWYGAIFFEERPDFL